MPDYKMCFKCLFKTGGVCDFEVHLRDCFTLLDRRKKRHVHQVLYAEEDAIC